jgi:ADP-ribose pyrophosphatase YjhB (NUDIX family)
MKPIEHFQFCPCCGEKRRAIPQDQTFRCGGCGFQYYFNPAIAAAAFVLDKDGLALFIRRAKNPAKGKLAIPGGFIDSGETAEGALRREIREEVNLEISSIEYLCSQPNLYPYKGVTYSVLDLFFVAKAEGMAGAAALDGVASYCWLHPAAVNPEELAFSSMQTALSVFQGKEMVPRKETG